MRNFIIVFIALNFFLGTNRVLPNEDTRDSQSPFGVLDFLAWDHEWNNRHYEGEKAEKAVELMKEAGVGFVRLDFLWNDIEPAYGEFDFQKYDKLVDLLVSHDIKILGLLSYNASWAASQWNSPPNKTFFVEYAKNVVRRYNGKVKYWEIWNEPDDPQYWNPQDDMKSYTELLKIIYPALKREDPSCVVVLGGLSKTIPISLRKIYNHGGKDYFDIVNFHPFVDPLLPNAEEMLHGNYKGAYRVMEQKGDADKPIWFSEIGCPGIHDSNPLSGWWFGHSPSEEAQAQWVRKVYDKPLQWKGVQKVFWAFFRDTPNYFRNGVDYFGLLREDFSKKPAYDVYKSIASAHEPFSKPLE